MGNTKSQESQTENTGNSNAATVNMNIVEPMQQMHDELVTLVFILVVMSFIWLAIQIFKQYHHCIKKKYTSRRPAPII